MDDHQINGHAMKAAAEQRIVQQFTSDVQETIGALLSMCVPGTKAAAVFLHPRDPAGHVIVSTAPPPELLAGIVQQMHAMGMPVPRVAGTAPLMQIDMATGRLGPVIEEDAAEGGEALRAAQEQIERLSSAIRRTMPYVSVPFARNKLMDALAGLPPVADDAKGPENMDYATLRYVASLARTFLRGRQPAIEEFIAHVDGAREASKKLPCEEESSGEVDLRPGAVNYVDQFSNVIGSASHSPEPIDRRVHVGVDLGANELSGMAGGKLMPVPDAPLSFAADPHDFSGEQEMMAKKTDE